MMEPSHAEKGVYPPNQFVVLAKAESVSLAPRVFLNLVFTIVRKEAKELLNKYVRRNQTTN
jgi:hypothetical protein